MSESNRSALLRYGGALAAVIVAALARLALGPLLGDLFPFATLFLAVLVIAGTAGRGPALLATAMGAAASARYFLPPRGSFAVRGVEDRAGLAVYLAVGAGVALLGGALRDARRRAERAADEAARERERLRITLASIGDAILVTDDRGRVTALNPVAEALTGWPAAEAAGRPLPAAFRILDEESRREVDDPAIRAIREGAVVGLGDHTVLIGRDGAERPIDGSAAPARDAAGRVVGAVLAFRAIGERRRAGDQARTILESISDAFFALGRDWRFTYVNRHAERLLGRTRADLLGKHLWEEYAPALGTEFGAAYHRAMAEDVTVTFEAYYPPHGRWYEVHVYPSPSGLSVYFRDISGRKRAEEEHGRLVVAAERQRRIYETALSSTPDFTYVFDLDGRFTYANAALLALWRKGLDEAVGRDFFELGYPPELAARLQRQVRQVIDTGGPVRDETPYTSHLGERQYEYIFVPVLGAGGAVEAVAGSTRDITERKRAEGQLREREERLRLIVESATDYAIFTMDLHGKVATWNAGARNLLGYEEAEIVGRDGAVLFIPEDIERGVPGEERRKALDRGRAENERWHVRKDGTLFWASGLLMPLRDGGAVVGLVKIMRDTTERKRIEQELEVSRERLDLVVNSSEVGLWYCDLPFATLVWNPKCKEHFGLPPDAAVTIDTFYGRIHPEDREATRRAITRSIEDCTEYDTEFRTVDARGRVRWVRAVGQPFFDVEGTPLRFDGITVDVTGRIEQELALKEADRRKDEFLATLAHELRNPLAPIRNALHLMRRPDADGELEAERAMAERQVVHLARLVDDLMDVARISRGQIELHTEVVDLATVVRQAVQTARTQVDDRRHRLSVALPEGPIRLEADPTRLEQVLWNLLNNAAKYTQPGGRIDLIVEPAGGEVAIRVRDTGMGMQPEMLSRIFEMFVQVRDHRDHAQGGLGIGLSLVQRLVELHGGSITAHSEGPGLGSEFLVRLPILAPAPQPGGPQPGRGSGAKPPGRRVLVVDDNVDAARSLARLLSRIYGQEVRVAHDGPEALAVAEEFRPEVFLLDIGLPGMDGNEVARQLRGRPEFSGSLIVALTGWGQESDLERSRAAGFDRHLVKPANPEAIRELLAIAGGGGPMIDAHAHCSAGRADPRFPYHARGPYQPEGAAPPEDLLACMAGAGVARAVLVQPEPYGDDHRYLEACLDLGRGSFKATCLFFADRPGALAGLTDLARRRAGQVVAARIHAYAPDRLPPFGTPELRAYWARAGELGLAIQLHFEPRYAPRFEPLIREFPATPVIVDHLGRPFQGTPEEYAVVLGWARLPNVALKLSLLPRREDYPHRDVGPIVDALIAAFGPGRLIAGGNFGAGITPATYRADRERLASYLDGFTTEDRAEILGGTAARLFGFDETCNESRDVPAVGRGGVGPTSVGPDPIADEVWPD